MRRFTDEALRAAVGQVFANIRASLGMSQGEVLDQTTLSKIEGGSNFPSWPSLLALCRKYRVSVHEVLRAAEESLSDEGGRTVAALDPDESELQSLYQRCNAEGRRVLLERARACAKLFPR